MRTNNTKTANRAGFAAALLAAAALTTAPAAYADPTDGTTSDSQSQSANDNSPNQQTSITGRPQTLQFKIGRFVIRN